MSAALLAKGMALLVVLPVVWLIGRRACHALPASHPARRFFEHHGALRLAQGLVAATVILGGVALTLIYS